MFQQEARQNRSSKSILLTILRSETEEPSDELSQIAARVLATSLPMYRKVLFTKLSPSLDNEQLHEQLPLTQQSVVELMFVLLSTATEIYLEICFLAFDRL